MLGAPVLPPAHLELCFFWTLHDRFVNAIRVAKLLSAAGAVCHTFIPQFPLRVPVRAPNCHRF